MRDTIAAADLDQQVLALSEGLRIVATRALGASEAEDVVQETLARAVASLRRSGPPSYAPLPAFVYGICKHVIVDVGRRRARECGLDSTDEVPAPPAHPLDALIRTEEALALNAALAQLPQNDQDLLRRCFVAGERVAEIARSSGEPAERVRKRKSRALERLRELISRPRDRSGHGSGISPIQG